MKKNRYQMIAAVMMAGVLAAACGSQEGKSTDANIMAAEADNAGEGGAAYTGTTIDRSALFSNRDLSGDYDAAKCGSIVLSDAGCTTNSENVTIDKSTVMITGEGDYIVSGTLSDGMIIVDVDKSEKVQLVLNGVDITSETSAAIYVKKADKVLVTLADNTENRLANGRGFEAIDENNIDAVIFSKDDLTLNGTGTLVIESPADHGIVSKNELVITNGTYHITAASHGLAGKDNVAIADGSFDITAGKDAIQSQNDDDDTLGFVYIAGGNYTLNAGSDGINAVNEIYIAGGTVVVERSEEGLEARIINISGGEIDITSSDDGLNATDKRSGASTDSNADGRGGFGGGMGDMQEDANINISGGIVCVDAEGDGVDSNGYLTVSGGELYVAASSNGGDGALDYGIDAVISGGLVVAAGQSGMAQSFGLDSTQGVILVNTQQQNAAGSGIALLDSEGVELVAWTMKKSYNSVVISCPEIIDGATYTVKTGEISTEIVMDGLLYGEKSGFGGGRHDFQKGGRPEGMAEPPAFEKDKMPESSVFWNGERPEFENGERPEGMPKPPGGGADEGLEGMDEAPVPAEQGNRGIQ